MALVQRTDFELTLAEYFRGRLQEFGRQLAPPPHEDTLWYMGNMLARFGDSDELFTYEQGERGIRPLALLYRDAVETSSEWERCQLLRKLGDTALFIGAVFPENYARKGIVRDYFVGMGGGAYDYLGDNARQYRHVFAELASKFGRMLELVARACARQRAYDAADVINLYQRWRNSGDPRLAAELHALGISLPDSDLRH